MDSPASDLSDYASDDFPEDVKHRRLSTPSHDRDDHDHDPNTRPSKRPRLAITSPEPAPLTIPPADEFGELSEDTDGSVPASPHHPGLSTNDDEYGHEQVTVCKWEGCTAGDLENMDNLVEHLHDDHIGTRQKKYSCEWSDCSRKGIPHASGYALRAHMRSHTREKPFYCTLPECDRSFTRSDALAKHMRTVHETEALRPSDPVPKHHSSNPSNRFQRLRLVLSAADRPLAPKDATKTSTPASPSLPTALPSNADAEYANNNVVYLKDAHSSAPPLLQFPPDMNFSERELSLPAPELFRLLCRQVRWATEEGEQLRAEAEALERKRREEWVKKELVFENFMEGELAYGRRRTWEKRAAQRKEGEEAAGEGEEDVYARLEEDVEVSRALEIEKRGERMPWWREEEWLKRFENSKPKGHTDEAAAVSTDTNAQPPAPATEEAAQEA